MSRKWYVFDTKQQADDAESEVSSRMGCSVAGINLGTSQPDAAACMTTRYAVPSRTSDNRWAFPVPDDPSHQIAHPKSDSVQFPPHQPVTGR